MKIKDVLYLIASGLYIVLTVLFVMHCIGAVKQDHVVTKYVVASVLYIATTVCHTLSLLFKRS